MITIRDHQSGDLFNLWNHLGELRRRLLERSWAGVFPEHLLGHLPVRELIAGFSREHGRPPHQGLPPALHAQVDSELVRKHVDREGDGRFASTKPSESRRRLPEAAADLLVLTTRFRPTAAELESFLILARVLAERCEVVRDPEAGSRVRVKEPDEMTCDNVLNPADPDATYNKHRGVGYLVQVVETYSDVEGEPTGETNPDPPDLITHVAVGPMNVHDGSSLGPALADAEARSINPKVVLADSHYGSNENLEKANLQGVEVVSPSMPPKGSEQEKLTLEHFELDEDGRVVRSPLRHAPTMTSIGGDKIQVLFDVTTCAACPLHPSCCASAVDLKNPAIDTRTTAFVSERGDSETSPTNSERAIAGPRGSKGRCPGSSTR